MMLRDTAWEAGESVEAAAVAYLMYGPVQADVAKIFYTVDGSSLDAERKMQWTSGAQQ